MNLGQLCSVIDKYFAGCVQNSQIQQPLEQVWNCVHRLDGLSIKLIDHWRENQTALNQSKTKQ